MLAQNIKRTLHQVRSYHDCGHCYVSGDIPVTHFLFECRISDAFLFLNACGKIGHIIGTPMGELSRFDSIHRFSKLRDFIRLADNVF